MLKPTQADLDKVFEIMKAHTHEPVVYDTFVRYGIDRELAKACLKELVAQGKVREWPLFLAAP